MNGFVPPSSAVRKFASAAARKKGSKVDRFVLQPVVDGRISQPATSRGAGVGAPAGAGAGAGAGGEMAAKASGAVA